MARSDISIQTSDGAMRAFAFTPEGTGPWPGVVFFMDGLAIRPAMFGMCERLASHGYVVLLPDMFWRAGEYAPLVPADALKDEETRKATFMRLMGTTNAAYSTSDTAACLAWLACNSDVAGSKVGVTGYCMGGGLALRAAGNFPDRVAAAGSFHGGRLATDGPDSPHLLAPRMKAKVLVAGADHDASYPPEMHAKLQEALAKAGVNAEVVIYQDALHGYAPPDMPVYKEEAAERHWRELIALFDGVLKS